MSTTKYRLNVTGAQIELLIQGIDKLIDGEGKSADKYALLGYLHTFKERINNGSAASYNILSEDGSRKSIRAGIEKDKADNKARDCFIKFLNTAGHVSVLEGDEVFKYTSNNNIDMPVYINALLMCAQFNVILIEEKYTDTDRLEADIWIAEQQAALGLVTKEKDIIDVLNL